jgi:hypothetical protein
MIMNNTNIETLKSLNKIDFLDVSLNNLSHGDYLEVIAIRKIKSKYGLRFYMLAPNGKIFQSSDKIYKMLDKLIINNDLILYDYKKDIYIYSIFLDPFFSIDIERKKENNNYLYNSTYPRYIKVV